MERVWTVEAGRVLCRAGVPVLTLHRVKAPPGPSNSYSTGGHTLAPWEADLMTRAIADAMEMVEAAARKIKP